MDAEVLAATRTRHVGTQLVRTMMSTHELCDRGPRERALHGSAGGVGIHRLRIPAVSTRERRSRRPATGRLYVATWPLRAREVGRHAAEVRHLRAVSRRYRRARRAARGSRGRGTWALQSLCDDENVGRAHGTREAVSVHRERPAGRGACRLKGVPPLKHIPMLRTGGSRTVQRGREAMVGEQ